MGLLEIVLVLLVVAAFGVWLLPAPVGTVVAVVAVVAALIVALRALRGSRVQ